jgi:hypothetical protein
MKRIKREFICELGLISSRVFLVTEVTKPCGGKGIPHSYDRGRPDHALEVLTGPPTSAGACYSISRTCCAPSEVSDISLHFTDFGFRNPARYGVSANRIARLAAVHRMRSFEQNDF